MINLGLSNLFYFMLFVLCYALFNKIDCIIVSDVRRSSQTGESTGDRPAFWDFGSGSSYNF